MNQYATILAALLAFISPAASQAQECGGDFETWRSDVKTEAIAAGVGERGMAALASASIDQKVLDRDRAQGVFNQTFAEFAGRMINDYRLKNGAANLKKYADVFRLRPRGAGIRRPCPCARSLLGAGNRLRCRAG